MNGRPKAIINVFVFNSEGDKLLVGKRVDDGLWSILSGRLGYGEDFEDCATRLLSKHANILIDKNSERLKFICSYNAVSKSKNLHLVAVDYYIQFTKEEEKYHLLINPYYFQSWNWYMFEEISKMYDYLYLTMQTFLDKFNITKFEDIKSLVSN